MDNNASYIVKVSFSLNTIPDRVLRVTIDSITLNGSGGIAGLSLCCVNNIFLLFADCAGLNLYALFPINIFLYQSPLRYTSTPKKDGIIDISIILSNCYCVTNWECKATIRISSIFENWKFYYVVDLIFFFCCVVIAPIVSTESNNC